MRERGKTRIIALAFAAGSLVAAFPGAGHANNGFALFHVNANAAGVIRSSMGVQTVVQTGTGAYNVTFNRTITTACTFVASLVGTAPGFTNAFNTTGSTTAVTVRTFNKTGVLTNLGFSLIVTCGP